MSHLRQLIKYDPTNESTAEAAEYFEKYLDELNNRGTPVLKLAVKNLICSRGYQRWQLLYEVLPRFRSFGWLVFFLLFLFYVCISTTAKRFLPVHHWVVLDVWPYKVCKCSPAWLNLIKRKSNVPNLMQRGAILLHFVVVFFSLKKKEFFVSLFSFITHNILLTVLNNKMLMLLTI